MSFKLQFEERAIRDLEELSQKQRLMIWERIQNLKVNPAGNNTRSLQGNLQGLRRLRVGDYRIGYLVDEDIIRIIIIGTRKHFYDIIKRRLD